MDDISNESKAVGLLQELGLKEYEARSFVALSRRPRGTAKEISEGSEVPRTRVYDAVRVLESKGLVEVQHSNPQQFRAVSVEEAVETLRAEYEDRIDSLCDALSGLEPAADGEAAETTHEVWTLSGAASIVARTGQLIEEADEEVVLVLGRESAFTEELAERLAAAHDRGVSVAVGTVSESLRERVSEQLPAVEVFVSGLDWLRRSGVTDDGTGISRLLLVDREAMLVSSFDATSDSREERAVFGRGFNNGLVAVVRRLMGTGLLGGLADGDRGSDGANGDDTGE